MKLKEACHVEHYSKNTLRSHLVSVRALGSRIDLCPNAKIFIHNVGCLYAAGNSSQKQKTY